MWSSIEICRGIAGCWLALGLVIAAPARAAELKDPLSPLNRTPQSMLCFKRDYAPEHLAQHPKQMVKSVLLAFQGAGFVTIVLQQRSGAPKRIGAGCDWRQGAGIDTSDRKMIPNFSKPAGFDCIVTVGNSAEEGGYALLDPAQDGKSLTLFLQSPVSTASDKPGKAKAVSLTLGPDDRTFALTRIDAKACEAYKSTSD